MDNIVEEASYRVDQKKVPYDFEVVEFEDPNKPSN